MTAWVMDGMFVICIALTVAGSGYAVAAALAMRGFSLRRAQSAASFPSVTILKPLHGDEVGLHVNLTSFCCQAYPGAVQIVFGVQDPSDDAIGTVRRLMAEFSDRDLDLVIEPHERGPNPKIANLIGMQARIRHEVVVIADSDIAVTPDYLCKVVAALQRPRVGLVTCLYRGAPDAGLWARLASMAIDYHFLPNVLVGMKMGLARPCFGSTIALRAETLRSMGGFEAFVNHLADDNAMGERVRAMGMKVAIPPLLVAHACPKRSAADLLRHELRWARTVRAVRPAGYAGLALTYPLPFALVAGFFMGFGPPALALVGLAIACRIVLQVQVDQTLEVPARRLWLGPLRDLLSFAVYLAGFRVSVVTWRGDRYRVRADGSLAPLHHR